VSSLQRAPPRHQRDRAASPATAEYLDSDGSCARTPRSSHKRFFASGGLPAITWGWAHKRGRQKTRKTPPGVDSLRGDYPATGSGWIVTLNRPLKRVWTPSMGHGTVRERVTQFFDSSSSWRASGGACSSGLESLSLPPGGTLPRGGAYAWCVGSRHVRISGYYLD